MGGRAVRPGRCGSAVALVALACIVLWLLVRSPCRSPACWLPLS